MNTSLEELSERIFDVKRRSGTGGMSMFEYVAVARAILDKAPCQLLVFGVGYDSELWIRCNAGGETVFVEDSEHWAELLRSGNPDVVVEQVEYARRVGSTMCEEGGLLEVELLALSRNTLETDWDIILVDAPKGHTPEMPGRSQSIYAASVLRSKRTTIFVHDVNRKAEREFCDRWLGEPPRITPNLAKYGKCEWCTRCSFFIAHTMRKKLRSQLRKGCRGDFINWRRH